MTTKRHVLTDAQYEVLSALLPANHRRGHPFHDHRKIKAVTHLSICACRLEDRERVLELWRQVKSPSSNTFEAWIRFVVPDFVSSP